MVEAKLKALRDIATQSGTTMCTLAYAWVLGTAGITALLTGPRGPEHIRSALVALETHLDAAQLKMIDQAMVTRGAESS